MRLKSLLVAAALSAALGAGAAAQDVSATPTYGSIRLNAGFQPDPFEVTLQSGGSVSASNLGAGCTGMIANAPDYQLTYSAGSLPLSISVDSTSDTTLVVNAPDGKWYCDDDGGFNGLNPALVFSKPQSGRYDIFVGTFGSAELRSAKL
jgi:hypothetical protein